MEKAQLPFAQNGCTRLWYRAGMPNRQPSAAFFYEPTYRKLAGLRRFGILLRPVSQFLGTLAGERPDVLVGSSPARHIRQEIVRLQSELCGHETGNRFRYNFASLRQPTRIPEGAKPKRKADPVFGSPSPTDVLNVCVIQRVVPQQRGFIRWKIE